MTEQYHANGSYWGEKDIAMLRLADVLSHGVSLDGGTRRDRLRQGGLIVGRIGRVGHRKLWICTEAGRALLRRVDAPATKADR